MDIREILAQIIKVEPHIHSFLENSRERWARIGEQVLCESVYSYICGIRHYAPNRFSALPNFQKKRILANTVCESHFSRLLINLCESRMLRIFGICLFSSNLGESTHVWFHLYKNFGCEICNNFKEHVENILGYGNIAKNLQKFKTF